MSSDIHKPIASSDIGVIRNVLRNAGFRFEEPMCELDRGAARLALRLYQNGIRKSASLTSAVDKWADDAALARLKRSDLGTSV